MIGGDVFFIQVSKPVWGVPFSLSFGPETAGFPLLARISTYVLPVPGLSFPTTVASFIEK